MNLAIIPARGGSKGLKHKNIRLLNGKPMIAYTIEAALKSKCVDRVVVSTDSEDIANISQDAGAEVPFIRPSHLSTDTAKSIDVVKHAINFYEEVEEANIKNVILLQPTSPLRNSSDIDSAMEVFEENRADSLQSVCPAATHPYLLKKIVEEKLLAYQENENSYTRRQDFDTLYQLNGAIYIARKDIIQQYDTLIGLNNYAYIMPKERSIDIDDIYDFKFAEVLLTEVK